MTSFIPVLSMRRLIAVLLLVFVSTAAAQPPAGAVASAHPLATAAGIEILEQGGNAFDAAVTVAAMLAVVEPFSSGMGGGGFWLLHQAATDRDIMVDGRETAPHRAQATMFLDRDGHVKEGASLNGPLSAGIPGQAAAFAHIAEHYGKLPLKSTLAPAIRVARDGFAVTPRYQGMARLRLEVLRASPGAATIFLHNKEVPPLGYRIRQPDLANTLTLLANKGRAGFYDGDMARKLVRGNRAAGGIWSLKDLTTYQVKEREPIRFSYHGYRITAAAPPSSGGVALATILNVYGQFPQQKADSVESVHLLVEAMRRAYRDRAEYLGDPDFVAVPVQRLISDRYARQLAGTIDPDRATPSDRLKPVADAPGGHHTTHLSILDREGNRVAATMSINYPFGSCFVVPGTGVLLNDEMDDFSAKPDSPNVYGLVGAAANRIEPGKRMLSSMTPTFVEGPERLAILGTPGGSRIITMVMHAILGVISGQSAEAIVRAPRYHHQYRPDAIQYEDGALTEAQRTRLETMGHHLTRVDDGFGNMQLVLWDRRRNVVTAASDPRGEGVAAVQQPKK